MIVKMCRAKLLRRRVELFVGALSRIFNMDTEAAKDFIS